jgi:hypothetical protein
LRKAESVDKKKDLVDEQSKAEAMHEQAEAINEQTENDGVDLPTQTEFLDEQPIAEPVYKSPLRTQFRGHTLYYN